MKLLFKIIFLISIVFSLSACVDDDVDKTLHGTSQNIFHFLNPKTANNLIISEIQQQQDASDLITRYFSPWTGVKQKNSFNEIKQLELEILNHYQQNPGWGGNHHPYTKVWINKITQNVDLIHSQNQKQKAIIVTATDLRLLPTQDPSYTNWYQAGEGYPFDNLQITRLVENTPVIILQQTRDGAWALVLTHNVFGWVDSRALANVDDNFIRVWMNNHYIAVTRDHVSVSDQLNHYLFQTRMGQLFPLKSETNGHYQFLVAVSDVNRNAQLQIAEIEKTNAELFPLALTEENIALLANRLMGGPYGWGDLYGYRDCSSTLADMFIPFGIWLPRNSTEQLSLSQHYTLKNLSRSQKLQLIEKKGIPFFTLLGWPGHVMLYIGKHHGKLYVFHDKWGIHTKNIFWQSGRAIIGKTVITPITLGENYFNVPESFLTETTMMTVLKKA